jgi:hypothetical protein
VQNEVAAGRDGPSASTLVYLCAGKVLPTYTAGALSFTTFPTPVPCTAVVVDTGLLGATLLAVAFWSLREQKLVALDGGEGAGALGRQADRIQVRRQGMEKRRGLEQRLLETLAKDGDGAILDVVPRAIGSSHAVPGGVVAGFAVQEAAALGYGQASGGLGRVFRDWLMNRASFTPDCPRIATLQAPLDAFLARWQRFRTAEAALYERLMTDCRGALAWCESTVSS